MWGEMCVCVCVRLRLRVCACAYIRTFEAPFSILMMCDGNMIYYQKVLRV